MHSNTVGGADSVAGPLTAAVAALSEQSLMPLTDEELVAALREVEGCVRRLVTVQHRLLIEVEKRSIPERVGAKTVKRFLMETLRLSGVEAGARVRAASLVGQFNGIDGELRDPQLPCTAKALADGEVSLDHVRGIAAVMNRVPRGVPEADREAAEQLLAEFARSGSPDDISKVGDRILGYLDPDGRLTSELDRARMRGVTIGKQRPDGMSPIKGEIDPVLRALLDPLLVKYARPGVCNPDDPNSPGTDVDGADPKVLRDARKADHRSAAQRNHDALTAILRSGLVAQQLGSHRGMPVSTVLTISVTDLENSAGVATTATGGMIPIRDALTLAERSRPYLAVFDHAGLPLHLGRMKRLASPAQRLALIATLRGCSRPGCDAPASLCAVHHVREYSKGGSTDIGNLVLACDACHALIHDGPGGWKTVVEGAFSSFPGRTGWIAPEHVDPSRTAKVNHRHHAGELFADLLTRIHLRDERRCQARRHRERRQHQRWLQSHPRPPDNATT